MIVIPIGGIYRTCTYFNVHVNLKNGAHFNMCSDNGDKVVTGLQLCKKNSFRKETVLQKILNSNKDEYPS